MVKLIPAKCPNCGANLQMPDTLDVGYCTHCGGKVIIDKEKVMVHHTGSVSSVPLCPSCENTLTEGNRKFNCELCSKVECHFCSQLSPREAQHFLNAQAWGRMIHNNDLALCRNCGKQKFASCIGCDYQVNGRYTGRPSGRCLKCQGNGKTGLIFTQVCTQCGGSGICPTCRGSTWVRLF